MENALQVAGQHAQHAILNNLETTNDRDALMELVGSVKTMALVNGFTGLALIQFMDQVKSKKSYKALGLTWDEFCPKFLNMSSDTAGRMVGAFKEFGPTYFQLSQVARLNAQTYRQIAGYVTPDGIEIDGEVIPITKANQEKITAFVEAQKQVVNEAQEQLQNEKAKVKRAKEQADGAKKAADLARDELAQFKRRDEELFAAAGEDEKLLLRAQSLVDMAVSLMHTVQGKVSFDAEGVLTAKLKSLGAYCVGQILYGTGDTMDGLMADSIASGSRNLIGEFTEEISQKKTSRKK